MMRECARVKQAKCLAAPIIGADWIGSVTFGVLKERRLPTSATVADMPSAMKQDHIPMTTLPTGQKQRRMRSWIGDRSSTDS